MQDRRIVKILRSDNVRRDEVVWEAGDGFLRVGRLVGVVTAAKSPLVLVMAVYVVLEDIMQGVVRASLCSRLPRKALQRRIGVQATSRK